MNTQTPRSPRTAAFSLLRLFVIAWSVAIWFAAAAQVRAEAPTPYQAGVSGPFKEQAADLEASVNLGLQLLDALNANCDPKIDFPNSTALDNAFLDLDAADETMQAAEKAVKGPLDADKSAEYKRHEAALRDAERRLENVGQKIDKYIKDKQAAKAAGDPPPYLTNSTIEAYEKAKADVERERAWLAKSPEMKQFNKDLPALKKALEAAQHAYDLAARDYVNALAAYDADLWNAVTRAAACQTNVVIEQGNGGDDAGQNQGGDARPTETDTPTPTPWPNDANDPTPIPQQEIDSDGDGLTDDSERELGTDPYDPDSDHEGLSDGDEVTVYGTNPLNADTDGDGIDDEQEVHDYFTDPFNPDTDQDGVVDGDEVLAGTDPLDPASVPGGNNGDADLPNGGSGAGNNGDADLPCDGERQPYSGLCEGPDGGNSVSDPSPEYDSDGDTIPDEAEVTEYGTNPNNADTDGDGYMDGEELMVYGTNPLDPYDNPELRDEAKG